MPYITKIFLLFSHQEILIPLIVLGLIFYRNYFLDPAILLLFTMVFSVLLKFIFAIPYPAELVQKLGKNGFSFPSGHMQAAAVFYGWFLLNNETVANQLFRRIFRNSNFFQTHMRLSTLTFEKNHNHKNFLEKLDLRQSYNKKKLIRFSSLSIILGIGFSLIYEGYHNIYDVLGAIFFATLTIIFYKITVTFLEKKFSNFPKELVRSLLIFFLIIFLTIILIVFYQLPPHLYIAIYSIFGINLVLLFLKNDWRLK